MTNERRQRHRTSGIEKLLNAVADQYRRVQTGEVHFGNRRHGFDNPDVYLRRDATSDSDTTDDPQGGGLK